MIISSLNFQVFSARSADLEAGYAPFLEGVFATREEADLFASEWNRLSENVEFWVEVK